MAKPKIGKMKLSPVLYGWDEMRAAEERGRELMRYSKAELLDACEEKFVRSEMERLPKREIVAHILDWEGHPV